MCTFIEQRTINEMTVTAFQFEMNVNTWATRAMKP